MACWHEFSRLSALKYANSVNRRGSKQCKLCGKTRKLIYFPQSKASISGYYSYCYECKRGINRLQDEKRKLSTDRKMKSRKAYLKRTYNLTAEQYENLEKSQDGGCAICGGLARLNIDHCHKTGNVRGLLCSNCNRGLGMFADDKSRLLNAIEYLG